MRTINNTDEGVYFQLVVLPKSGSYRPSSPSWRVGQVLHHAFKKWGGARRGANWFWPAGLNRARATLQRVPTGATSFLWGHAMGILRAFSLALIVITAGVGGCETHEVVSSPQQEDRGLGIVQGTLGTMRGARVPSPASVVMQGQVLDLEGGAYVVRSLSGDEMRVPLDENTSIDRPARVGDHIEVYLDEGHRATQIRNIDHYALEQ